MPKLLKLVLRDIALALAGSVLAWLAISSALDCFWLGRPLWLSLSHWVPSFAGCFVGLAFVNVLRTVVQYHSERFRRPTLGKPQFKRLAPQKVRNVELDYLVQSADRYHVEYVEPTRTALVEVEHGPVTAIYRDSLTLWNLKEGSIEMNIDDREMVLSRISLGLRAMGSKCEIY